MAKSIRVSEGIYELAAKAGDLVNRSLADQVEYWARLGAAIDAAGITLEQVVRVLAGDVALKKLIGEHITSSRKTARRRAYSGDASIAERVTRFDREVANGTRTPESLLLFSRRQAQAARVTFAEEAKSKAAQW